MSQSAAENPSRILYVDDDPVNRTLVNRLLSSYDFKVIEATTGMEGLQIAQKNPPDLVLMDINMPGLDGNETTTRMRGITGLQDIPIVAVTAVTTKGARELALAAGCNGYISKPIDIDEFPHQIIAYLEGQHENLTSDEKEHYLGQYSKKLVERLETKILELEDANLRLQKIDKVKADFITVAAHELRTPITLIYGYAKLLQSEVETSEDPDKGHGSVFDLAGRIYHSIHRLSEVVNDILNISLIEANEMRIERTPVNLETIISAALQDIDPTKNDRQLNITIEEMDNLPLVMGDASRLQQMFWNILSNAIKSTPDGGSILIKGQVVMPDPPNAERTFNISAQESQQGSIIVSVKDNGIGIDVSEQMNIFDRFYIVDDTTYHSSSKTAFGGGGMGLGLPIARGIVEAHDGRIWVESTGRQENNENSGSTFYVLLPLDTTQDQE